MCQPRSQIYHHQHASTQSRFRRFVWLRNRELVQKKWAAVLEQQEPFDDIERALERARSGGVGRRPTNYAKPVLGTQAFDRALQREQHYAKAYALQKAFADHLCEVVEDAQADRWLNVMAAMVCCHQNRAKRLINR